MLIDARTDLEGESLEADVCIIGAGAAGITIAREFANTRTKVCVLESGGLELEAETQSLYEGENTGLEYFALDTTRLRYFGGTTNHWGGMSAPLFPIDFEERPWVPMSGWPFDLTHLVPYYMRAHEICELGPFDYSPERLESLLATKKIPLEPDRFRSSVLQYSPPTRFGKEYRDTLQMAQNITVVLNANALELEANEAVSNLQRVKCQTLAGKEFFAKSRLFVLATGGIENPRLLLLSNRQRSVGLGNESGLVGRFFMEHPRLYVGTVIPEDPLMELTMYDGARWRRKQGIRSSCYLTPSDALQRDQNLLNAKINIHPKFGEGDGGIGTEGQKLFDAIGRYLRNHGLISNRNYRIALEADRPIEWFDVGVSMEQTPNFNSRVGLSQDRDPFGQNRVELNWAVNGNDLVSMERMTELFAQEVGKVGIGRMKIEYRMDERQGSNHHMGTTRMHPDPTQGVVDAQSRLHGVANLFVAGSSVFPTSGAVNPTLTIVALALRLADHLKEKLL